MQIRTLALLAAVLSPLPALADTTYTYTGSPFTFVSGVYTTSNAIAGQFTLATPLAPSLPANTVITPLTFSFTDGVQTVTDASYNTSDSFFFFQTDAAGNISLWDVYLTFNTPDGGASIETMDDFIGVAHAVGDEATHAYSSGPSLVIDGGNNVGPAGAWTETTTIAATPEPASLMLLATGLAGTGAILRRTRTPSCTNGGRH